MVEKEEVDVLENLESLERSQKIKKLLVVAIISVLLIIIVFISFSVYTYMKSPEKTLGVGANIEKVIISEDGEVSYVKLLGGSLDKNITKIKFIFTAEQGNEYVYETIEGTQEISVPFKRSFWDWLFGRQFEGNYDYEIKADEINLNNFQNIKEVSVSFEYKTKTGEIIETPKLDTTKPTPVPTPTPSPGGGGGGGGEGGTTPVPEPACIPESRETTCGIDVCGIKKNNCNENVDCGSCNEGYECQSGQCIEIITPPINCTDDEDCFSAGGFCDEFGVPYECIVGEEGCLEKIYRSECANGTYCEDGTCIQGCVNECQAIGDNFCYGNIPYNCSLGADGCLKRILASPCGLGEICLNGKCVNETVPNPILYQDNFEDGNYNESDPTLNNSLSWEVISGNASVIAGMTNKSLCLKRQNTTIISEQTFNYNEFTIETDISVTYSRPSKILFLYIDENNYYFFGITGESGFYRVMDGIKTRIDEGIYTSFHGLPHAGGSVGKYKIYIKNDGNSIKFKVDKGGFADGIDYEMELEDTNSEAVSKFRNTKIGFQETSTTYYSDCWVRVDNVVVYEGLKKNTRIKPIETYYVSTTGNDLNPGTQALPWRTIQKAADTMMAGDSVLIASGVYEEHSINPKYSGAKDYPITYKALDYNNKPVLVGTVTLSSGNWTLHNGSIYKTVLDWSPNALYLNNTQLFIAQEPNQENPDDQMELEYFRNVNNSENNESAPESKYQLVDSNFFTQPDDFWDGGTLLLYDGYGNGISSRNILDYIQSEHKIIIPYSNVGGAQQDKYAIRHLSILDKPGEYYIDKGLLEVVSWNENPDKTLEINVSKISGAGNTTNIRVFLINGSYSSSEVTINTNMQTYETKNFTINLTGKVQNLIMVYAVVEYADKYELYVWPYLGQNLKDIEISKYASAFSLGGTYTYHEYTIFDGLEIKQYQETPLSFSISYGSNRNSVVKNSDIHHNMGSGVYCRSKCNGLNVSHNKLHNNYRNGINIGGGRNYIIEYNEIYENLNNGIWVGMGDIPNICYVWDIIIRGNYIHHQGSRRAHPDNIQFYRICNVTVDANYLLQEGHQNTWFSNNGPLWFTNNIVINGTAGINSANESYIYNNVFYRSTIRLDAWQGENFSSTKHSEIRNNVFIDSGLNMPPERLWNNVIFSNNFYSIAGTTWARGENNIFNPNASDPTSLYNYFSELENFTLKLGSELIDAGYFPVPTEKDYKGNRRFQGAKPDIGVIETSNLYSYEDCSNNIKDGNEQGVDCGGICEQDFDKDSYNIGLCSGVNDCNDSNSAINPGAEEICDKIDNNCDGQQHPDYYTDSDSDSFNNCIDTCPFISNPSQEDFDNDGIGDVCDSETTYIETFDLRFTGMNDLNETKVPNGLSWEIISGIPYVISFEGGKVIEVPVNGANKSVRVLLIAKEGSQWQNLTLSLKAKKAWSPTNPGFVFLYKNSSNYYFFNIKSGSLIKRVDGIDSIIDSNSALGIAHADGGWHNYTLEISYDGSKVSFNVTKNNSVSTKFVDSSPHSTRGTIGLLRDSGLRMVVNDIVVTVKSEVGAASTLSPFAKLWNFLKSLLTGKTGQAILTGKTINGNAVGEDERIKVPYIILSLLVVIILIIVIIIVKIKKNKKKSGERIRKRIRKMR